MVMMIPRERAVPADRYAIVLTVAVVERLPVVLTHARHSGGFSRVTFANFARKEPRSGPYGFYAAAQEYV